MPQSSAMQNACLTIVCQVDIHRLCHVMFFDRIDECACQQLCAMNASFAPHLKQTVRTEGMSATSKETNSLYCKRRISWLACQRTGEMSVSLQSHRSSAYSVEHTENSMGKPPRSSFGSCVWLCMRFVDDIVCWYFECLTMKQCLLYCAVKLCFSSTAAGTLYSLWQNTDIEMTPGILYSV